MKVLFLTQWYPHRYDSMAGLFVRKHAEAVARQEIDVCVLYCHPDAKVQDVEVVEQTTNGVREIYIYYSYNMLRALWRAKNEVLERWGIPDVCQINVLSKSALIANYLYRLYKVPYVVVEHWSGYLPANGDYKRNTGQFQQWIYRNIARSAKCILPVSHLLQESMQACGMTNENWQIIHNVVDDFFYQGERIPNNTGITRILHVSCFDEKAKNIKGTLRAVSQLSTKRGDIQLTIIGTGPDFEEDRHLSDTLGLTDRWVFFRGEQTPEEVHRAMLESDLFVLFSRYENAPVVLSECMATGLPIVASKAGGIPEMVNEDTGILVPIEDEEALCKALEEVITKQNRFDSSTIKKYGRQYTYQAVGAQLKTIYDKAISK